MLRGLVVLLGKGYFWLLPRKKPDFSKVNKIMIIKPGAIGDILMTTPFLRGLRKRFPKAKIHFYIGKWSADILKQNPNIDEMIVFDDNIIFKKKFIEISKLIKKIRKQKYDICFTLDRNYLANLFTYACKIPIRVGFDRRGEGFANTINIPYNDLKHDVEFYLDLAKAVGAQPIGKNMELFLTKQEKQFPNKFLKQKNLKKTDKIIGVSPGGGKNPGQTVELKRWPEKRYTELCKKLVKNYKIIFFGGPSDVELIQNIQNNIKAKTYNSAGKTKLRESAALMTVCKAFICNDSGPMHMAAAMDVPVISIFGPTDPVKLAPIGKKHIVVKSTLGCMPCYHDGSYADCKHHTCMRFIKAEHVLKALNKVIK